MKSGLCTISNVGLNCRCPHKWKLATQKATFISWSLNVFYSSVQMSLPFSESARLLVNTFLCFGIKQTWAFIVLKCVLLTQIAKTATKLDCSIAEWVQYTVFEFHFINFKLVTTKCTRLKITWGPFGTAEFYRSSMLIWFWRRKHWTKLWQCWFTPFQKASLEGLTQHAAFQLTLWCNQYKFTLIFIVTSVCHRLCDTV